MNPTDLVPPDCCACGCGGRVPVGRTALRGHVSHRRTVLSMLSVDPQTGCWLWGGKLNKAGYGVVRRGGRDWLIHRWTYHRLVGGLDPNLVLDHRCRRRSCANPTHVEQTTDAVNVRRGRATKLTVLVAARVRHRAATWPGSQRGLAREMSSELGVAESTIRNLLGGFTWSDPRPRTYR